MGWWGRKRKREDPFVELLGRQAQAVRSGLEALKRFVAEGSPEAPDLVRRAEKEGDEIRRILIDELHKTFITPFDREDIFDLSLYLDDVLDYAQSTVEEMQLLGVAPDPHLTAMVGTVSRAAEELFLAMQRLSHNPMVALDHARRAKYRENEVERIYREAVAALFSRLENMQDIKDMLRRREVYRHVSNAADRVDMAANTIGTVVVKMT